MAKGFFSFGFTEEAYHLIVEVSLDCSTGNHSMETIGQVLVDAW
jgi:hypothetical protein